MAEIRNSDKNSILLTLKIYLDHPWLQIGVAMFDDIDTGFFDSQLQIQAGFLGYVIAVTGLPDRR